MDQVLIKVLYMILIYHIIEIRRDSVKSFALFFYFDISNLCLTCFFTYAIITNVTGKHNNAFFTDFYHRGILWTHRTRKTDQNMK